MNPRVCSATFVSARMCTTASGSSIQASPMARWIRCSDAKKLEEFRDKHALNLGIDAADQLVYLAPTRVNLQLAQERASGVEFLATREHAHGSAGL